MEAPVGTLDFSAHKLNIMPRFSKAVSSLRSSEIRDLMTLASRPDIISFAGGMPGNELFPVKEIE